jgi:hypothetical protein
VTLDALSLPHLLAPDPLRRLLQRTGWSLDRYGDGPDHFLAVADASGDS